MIAQTKNFDQDVARREPAWVSVNRKRPRNPGEDQVRLANQRAGVRLARSGRVRRFNPGSTAASKLSRS